VTLVRTSSGQPVLALLMQEVQHGDHAAFGRLYDLTQERVARVVTSTVRSPEHSAEVVQEVYLYAWQHAASFDAVRGTVIGWLMTLARRRAVDRVRHVVRSRARDQRDADAAERTVPDVADLGLARHEAARLTTALWRLSGAQRDAVVLTFLDGHTHEQAAVLLRVPLGTLKTRIRAGVTSLRLQLAEPAA
jgi:RNA polymerase sigma-70 factor (ECF subfamily)